MSLPPVLQPNLLLTLRPNGSEQNQMLLLSPHPVPGALGVGRGKLLLCETTLLRVL